MKKIYALLHLYALLVACTFAGWMVACEEKEDFVPLKIFSVEPAEALINDTIMIRGEGFSPGIQHNNVQFTGVSGMVTPLREGSNEKELWVVVPEGAQAGPVTVNLFNEEVADSPQPLMVLAPVVESIEPSSGLPGDTVIIRGKNFRPELDKNRVRFNPADANNPNGWGTVLSASSDELRVIVPTAARTGKVSVLKSEGAGFTVLPPSITAIQPLRGVVGDTISILGRGFGAIEAMTVTFGGSGSNRGTILSKSTSRRLQVIVPEDARDGIIKVNYSSVGLQSDQTFEVYPSITNVSPLNGVTIRTTVTINGFTFSDVDTDNIVRFGGLTSTEVTSVSTRQLKAVVPAGAETGAVTVEINGRVATGPVFGVSPEGTPIIFSIFPASGTVGSQLTIKGDYFNATPSANIVKFTGTTGDVEALVLAASRTQLTVKVPEGAVTGAISVTTDGLTGQGPEFALTQRDKPYIDFVSPELIARNTDFVIHGGNFASDFKEDIFIISSAMDGVLHPAVASATELTVRLPANAKPGEHTIRVTQYGENSNLDKRITVEGNPHITSLSVQEGLGGASITITGTEFHNIENKNKVTFSNAGGDFIAPFINESESNETTIGVKVPNAAPPGVYNVTVEAFGHTSNAVAFTIKERPAAVKSVYYSRAITTAPTSLRITRLISEPSLRTETVYDLPGPTTSPIRSLVVDVVTGENGVLPTSKVYMFTLAGNIIKSNIDNTGAATLYTGQNPQDITLDATNGKLYWSRSAPAADAGIWRGDVGGSSVEAPTRIYTASSGTTIRGLTYSPDDRKIYFCEIVSGSGNNISSIDLDDTPPHQKTVLKSGLALLPVDVKIDKTNQKIFIMCGANATSPTGRRTIYKMDLDGSNLDTEFHVTPTSSMDGIALDVADQYVYWLKSADDADGTKGIYRKRYNKADIPGTNPPATFQKVYDVENLSTNTQIFGGLAIDDLGGKSATQRKRKGSSGRGSSPGFTFEFTNYE